MSGAARVIATDLGASDGRPFKENDFTLREIHRFSHERTVMHIADRNGTVEERSFWDDLLIYAHIIEGLRIYRREIGNTADAWSPNPATSQGCHSLVAWDGKGRRADTH